MSVKRYDFSCSTLNGLCVEQYDDGDYVRYSDYAFLLARYNALREAVHKAMGRTALCDKKQTDGQLIADISYLNRLASDYFKTSVDCGNRAFAAEQKYDALIEKVEWERECAALEKWFRMQITHSSQFDILPGGFTELFTSLKAARAEVYRMLGRGEE